MANVPKTAGISSYVLWGKETNFKTAATTDSHFGLDTNFSANLSNNLNARRGMKGSATSGRDVQKFIAGKSVYNITMEFDLNDPSFLEHLLGDKTGSAYSGADIPSSLTIANCIDNDTTDRDEIYTGVVLDSATIRGAEGEPITVNLSAIAATMDKDTTLTSNVAINSNSPFTFTEATFELPNGTAINNIVESFELTVNNNYTMLYGSNREAQNYVPGAREYSLKLSTKYVDDGLLEKALGGSTIAADEPTQNATVEILLTRPNNDTLTILGTVAPIDNYSLSAQLNNPIGEDIDIRIQTMTITESLA
ncbi:MAG: hypothetical protein EOL95_10470 [Bacteroidia bacterium]|nr:hypothetical protein [Bacteroidia bacterium]